MTAKSNKTGYVLAGLLLGILMAAMDNTIVATAMGTVVSDLGGFDKFVWVTSAYMVAFMAGTPIFGKLSDMYGRKRFFIAGLVFFILGSALCGTAQSMIQLSLFRAVQGIGGGAIFPIAFTVIADIYPPEKRGKIFGLFGAAFGLSSILGPLLGAFITEGINWRWVFYINLPLGLVSLAFIVFTYHETREHSKQKIDWMGASTLVGAVVSLMFALELGGNEYAWNSNVILGLFAVFAVLLAAFLYAEKNAVEPIISFEMFKDRLFATSNLSAFLVGMTFIAATVFIPILIQGVLGGSATNSGFILMPMMLGSVLGSQLGGFLTTKTSYRNIMLGSVLFLLVGIFLLGQLTPETSRSMVVLDMILTGFGVGFSFSVLSMSAIHNISMRQRGSATSTNRFIISMGNTLGITAFGIIQRSLFTRQMEGAMHGQAGPLGQSASSMLTPEGRSKVPQEVLHKMVEALSSSIAHTFMWALIPAVLAALSILLMSNERLTVYAKGAAQPAGQPGKQ
jgi:EmrB/QacA subfamily drug resistance transporter